MRAGEVTVAGFCQVDTMKERVARELSIYAKD
jgi:hypothetical protein